MNGVAGLDEAQARAALTTMHERLGRGPHAVLGVPFHPAPEEIRAAFLALTKIYHPARFGRMSADVQRFANEVFLGIKGAHDALRAPEMARTTTAPGAPGATGPHGAPTTMRPSVPGIQPLARPTTMGMPPIQRPPTAVPTAVPPARQGTDRFPLAPNPNPAKQTGPVPVVPSPNPARQTGPVPLVRNPPPTPATPPPRTDRTMPMPTRIANPPPAQPLRPTPAGTTAPLELQRSREPATKPRPIVRMATEAFPRVDTTPGVTSAAPVAPRLDPSTTRPPAPSVAVAVDMLAQRQWDAARVALSALTAMAPDSKHVRALICYAAGRQAQVEQRLDEARVDLQRALQLDPDLTLAKTALSELFLRRK